MPVYEYFCSNYGLKFELLRPMSQAAGVSLCPRGGGANEKQGDAPFLSFLW